jgi:hypothetical protein
MIMRSVQVVFADRGILSTRKQARKLCSTFFGLLLQLLNQSFAKCFKHSECLILLRCMMWYRQRPVQPLQT